MYAFLDVFFVVLHGSLVLFNLTGWIWRGTRRLHLWVVGLTVFSWFGLGVFYGWGYCPLTDWHWQVKRVLGETGLPASYVKYYADHVTGLDLPAAGVDAVVVLVGVGAFVLSLWLNHRDRRASRAEPGREGGV